MAKGIVAMQAGIARLAESFPGAFSGYELTVTESHQKTKADTSGKTLSRRDELFGTENVAQPEALLGSTRNCHRGHRGVGEAHERA
eukprot:2240345-Prorocentrum_lima.AAC.1